MWCMQTQFWPLQVPHHLNSHREKTTGTSWAHTIWLCCNWKKLLVHLARGELAPRLSLVSPKVFSPFCHRWSFGSLPLSPLACLVGDTTFPVILVLIDNCSSCAATSRSKVTFIESGALWESWEALRKHWGTVKVGVCVCGGRLIYHTLQYSTSMYLFTFPFVWKIASSVPCLGDR